MIKNHIVWMIKLHDNFYFSFINNLEKLIMLDNFLISYTVCNLVIKIFSQLIRHKIVFKFSIINVLLAYQQNSILFKDPLITVHTIMIMFMTCATTLKIFEPREIFRLIFTHEFSSYQIPTLNFAFDIQSNKFILDHFICKIIFNLINANKFDQIIMKRWNNCNMTQSIEV